METQTQSHSAPQTDAGRINLEAGAWIERRDFGEWTENDSVEFEKWLDAAPEHRVAFLRLEAGWQRGEIMVALRPLQPEPQISVRAARSRLFGMIAIGLVCILTAAGAATAYLSSSQSRVYETGVGGRQIIALNDGSQIELNTDTVLRVAEKSNQRTIWLDRGEAYFQVKHDTARPFVVKTGAYRVVDLGTKFSVRTSADRIEVALMEGRARLQVPDAKTGTQSADLTPGDVAVATATAFSVTKKPIQALAYDLGWRQGVLMFHETSLADAAADFNRYNDAKLIVGDRDAAHLKINGTFPVHDVAEFARVARDVFGLRVVSRAEETMISR